MTFRFVSQRRRHRLLGGDARPRSGRDALHRRVEDVHHARDDDQRAHAPATGRSPTLGDDVGGRQALRRGVDQRRRGREVRHRHRQHVRVLGLGRRPLLVRLRDRPLADDRDRPRAVPRDARRLPRRSTSTSAPRRSSRTCRCSSGSSASGTTTSSAPRRVAILPYNHYLVGSPRTSSSSTWRATASRSTARATRSTWQTGPIVWGQPGTNGQHAYYQLIHQGTKLIPCDFIGFVHAEPRGRRPPEPAHGELLRAARGARVRQDRARRSRPKACPREQVPHRTFAGQPPDELDPRRPSSRRTRSASSIALYEHKVFTQGAIWNINCFDQWGVELGKKLAHGHHPRARRDRRARARARLVDERPDPPLPRLRAEWLRPSPIAGSETHHGDGQDAAAPPARRAGAAGDRAAPRGRRAHASPGRTPRR